MIWRKKSSFDNEFSCALCLYLSSGLFEFEVNRRAAEMKKQLYKDAEVSKNHVEECLGGAHDATLPQPVCTHHRMTLHCHICEPKPDAIRSHSCPGPDDSAARKAAPLWSGVMRYFPDALLAVARLSKKGNDKHNPGEPLHWSREKSTDHGDCIARHQLNPEAIDPDTGEVHAVAVAWRALAQLQIILEKRK